MRPLPPRWWNWHIFWAPLGAIVAALLLAGAHDGPDSGHYADWARVFRSGDIAHIRGDVLSPMRVPLSQWSFGPGLIFSTGSAVGGETTELSALAVGWVGVLVFWVVMSRILDRVTGGDRPLTLLGLGICFVGTHLGFYSTAISSEALSYPALLMSERVSVQAGVPEGLRR